VNVVGESLSTGGERGYVDIDIDTEPCCRTPLLSALRQSPQTVWLRFGGSDANGPRPDPAESRGLSVRTALMV
jgi:hypothetical protein